MILRDNDKLKTSREVLDMIDEFLVNADKDERVHVWNVLTALRSSDVDDTNYQQKYDTTCVIRAAAFPQVAKESGGEPTPRDMGIIGSSNALGAYFRIDKCRKIKFPKKTADNGHFLSHLRDAAQALGLESDHETRTEG